jgi:hypothetical protein
VTQNPNAPPATLTDAEQAWRDNPDPLIQKSAREYFKHRELEKLPGDVVKLYDENHKLKQQLNIKARDILVLQAEIKRRDHSLLGNWLVTLAQLLGLAAALIKVFWR